MENKIQKIRKSSVTVIIPLITVFLFLALIFNIPASSAQSTAGMSMLTSITSAIPAGAALGSLSTYNSISTFNNPSIFTDSTGPFSFIGPLFNPFYYKGPALYSPVDIPTGLASYGLYNEINSNTNTGYVIGTQEVEGTFNITSMATSSVTLNGDPLPGQSTSSVQLNTLLNFQYMGKSQTFWLQNVFVFDTNDGLITSINNNIWNFTTQNANMNLNSITGLTGTGQLIPYTTPTGAVQVLYAKSYLPPSSTGLPYALPLNATLYIKILPIGSGSTERTAISFGFKINDNSYRDSVVCELINCNGIIHTNDVSYDTIFLPVGSTSPTLLVAPYTVPTSATKSFVGYPYDTEFVFGGPYNGAKSTFSNFNAQISLKYLNGAGQMTNFPSYWTFGTTGETATNLMSNVNGAGVAIVSIGTPNPLSGISTTYTLQQLIGLSYI